MILRPQRSTRTDTLFPYTTLFRSPLRILGAVVDAAVRGDLHRHIGGRRDCDPAAVGTDRAEELALGDLGRIGRGGRGGFVFRSEEHTSELQSLMRISYAVICMNKKNQTN